VEVTTELFTYFQLELQNAYKKSAMDLGNLDSSTKCKFHPLFTTKYFMATTGLFDKGSTLIATGTNENKPEIHIWEKKVSDKKCHTKFI